MSHADPVASEDYKTLNPDMNNAAALAMTLLVACTSAYAGDLASDVGACSGIPNGGERLACYDKAAAHLFRTAQSSGNDGSLKHQEFSDSDFKKLVIGKSPREIMSMFGQPNTAEDGGSGRTFMYKFGTPPAYISVKDSVTRRTYGNIYLNFDSKETVRSVNLF